MIQHVARRGIENGPAFMKRAVEKVEFEMSPWAAVVLAVTLIVSMVAITLVSYTLTDMLPILTMVETPAAAITISQHDEPASKDEKETLLETGTTVTLVHQKPITSSIRGTIRHLVNEAGRFARYRGLRYEAVYGVATSLVMSLCEAFVPRALSPLRYLICAAITGAATANLHAAWTHKVISTPSDASLWSRVPSRKQWKVLALPAAVAATMPYISLGISMALVSIFRLDHEANNDMTKYCAGKWASYIARCVFVVVVSVASTIFLCMPAIVTLVRVEASILPEDQDTIVPFDRTFGGKVVSKALGGTGCVSFMDAWRSFNWEARRRLIKMYIKGFMCVVALAFVLVHVVAFVTFLVMGSQLGDFLAASKHALAQ